MRRIENRKAILIMSAKTKQSEIRKIPKLRFSEFSGEWQKNKLEDMEVFVSDGNYGEMYPKASEMKDSGVPFIRANNIKNLKIVWDDMKYINDELHGMLQSGHLKKDDILVTTRGNTGTLAYVDEDFNNANINAQICLLRCGKNISPRFLLNYLSSRIGQKQFKELQTGSALQQLPKGNLAKIKFNLPFLPEQQKIAEFLGTTDEWIENLRLQKKLFEFYKKGITQKIFSQGIRFKDNEGNNFSRWKEKKLGDVCDLYQPRTISKNEMIKNGKFLVFGANGIIGRYNKYNHENSEIAITCRGATCGNINFTKPKSWITGNAMIAHPINPNLLDKIFMFYYLKFVDLNSVITGMAQPQITRKDLKLVKIVIPLDIKEQQKIAKFLTSIDDSINSKQQQITQVESWKKGLMQGLFV